MKWDEYYLNICNKVAENSKCLSRKIGAILVDDKSIVSTGYNGPPRNVAHCSVRHQYDEFLYHALVDKGIILSSENKFLIELQDCPRRILGFKSGEGLQYCISGHSERNALINAARSGIRTKGLKMYMSCAIPCKDCLVEIINAGIEEIIYTDYIYYDKGSKYLLMCINNRVYNG